MRGSKHAEGLRQIGLKVTDSMDARLREEVERRRTAQSARFTMTDLARELFAEGLDRLDAERRAKTGT